MKTKRRTTLVSLAVFLILAGLILPKLGLFQTAAENAAAPGDAVSATPVKSYIVHPETLHERVITSGTLRANEQVELKSEIAGKITDIYFQEGSRVQSGDLLIKINDSELQAQLLKLEQQKDLAAQREYRQSQLLQKQAISQEDYDQTLNELENLEAESALIRARIDKTEIRAPFDGMIGLRYVSIGDYISPATQIASLQDIDPVKIDFSIPEKYTPMVGTGDEIEFTAESLARSYRAKVYAIEPKIDPETRTLQLRAIASNTGENILPGLFVKVELLLEEIPNALMIPTEAIIPELESNKVFLVRGNKVISQPVTTGLRTEDKIQILQGIQPEDTVVTEGLLEIRNGTTVQITEFVE